VAKNEEILSALEAYGTVVDLFTGVKAKFIEAGWSEAGAEMAVIRLLGSVYGADRPQV
jgi:hypothetical protein